MRYLLAVALAMPGAALAQSLDASGTCPGAVDISMSGLTADGDYVFLWSSLGEGAGLIPAGRCAGTVTGLAGMRFGFRSTADRSGAAVFSPTAPEGVCGMTMQVLDLTTCTLTNTATFGGDAAPAVLGFPASDSYVWTTFSDTDVMSTEGSGAVFMAGSYVEDTYSGTGLTSVVAADLDIEMYDGTTGCAVGEVYDFNFSINGVYAGTYTWIGGAGGAIFPIVESYRFDPISGTGPSGDDYVLRIEAMDTVCPGGSSWSWMSGGTTTLSGDGAGPVDEWDLTPADGVLTRGDDPYWAEKGYQFTAAEDFTLRGGAWLLDLPADGYVQMRLYDQATGGLLAEGPIGDYGTGVEDWYEATIDYAVTAGTTYGVVFYTNRAATALFPRQDGCGVFDVGPMTALSSMSTGISGDDAVLSDPVVSWSPNSWCPHQMIYTAP